MTAAACWLLPKSDCHAFRPTLNRALTNQGRRLAIDPWGTRVGAKAATRPALPALRLWVWPARSRRLPNHAVSGLA